MKQMGVQWDLMSRSHSLLWGLVLGVVLLSVECSAQTVQLNVHGPSWHSEKKNANNQTWGGGMEVNWKQSAWQYGVLGGGYYNSDRNPSLYLGVSGSYSITEWAKIGIGLAAATGYDKTLCFRSSLAEEDGQWCFSTDRTYGVMPMLWPFLSIGQRLQLRILASADKGGYGHFILSLRL